MTEQLIFPEIDYDKIDSTRGMDITIVTTATRPTPKAEHCSMPSASRSDRRTVAMAKKALDQQAAEDAQVQGAGLHPLSPLWSSAFRVSQVRPVPCLPARAGPCRRDPGRDQGELVRR